MNILADFAAEFPRCWLCGARAEEVWRGLAIHHIVRGSGRSKTRTDRRTLIRTCYYCHEGILDSMSVVAQLALKKLNDPSHYDRVHVNRLRRRADNSITEEEVCHVQRELLLQSINTGYPYPRRGR